MSDEPLLQPALPHAQRPCDLVGDLGVPPEQTGRGEIGRPPTRPPVGGDPDEVQDPLQRPQLLGEAAPA